MPYNKRLWDREYYARNRERLLKYQQEYRRNNKQKVSECKKKCYYKKPDYYVAQSVKYRLEHLKEIENKRRHHVLQYKGSKIKFPFEIRCGVCNLCRAIELIDTPVTQRHHNNDVYYDDDPLKNTIEICVSCHARITFGLI